MKNSLTKKLRLFGMAAILLGGANLIHAQAYKWAAYSAAGTDLQTTADVANDGKGFAYAAGWFQYEADFDGTFGSPFYMSNDDGTGAADDGYISKISRDGTIASSDNWAIKVCHGSNTAGASEHVNAIATYPDGLGGFNLYVTGTYTGSSLKFVRYNYAGSTTTYTTTVASPSGQGAYVAKLNDAGTLQWCYRIDGTGTDNVYDICVNGSIVCVVGAMAGSAVGYGNSTNVTVTSTGLGGFDAFMITYDDAGTTSDPQWGAGMGDTGNDAYLAVAAGVNGDIVAAGQIRGGTSPGDIYDGSAYISRTYSGANDAVFARYDVNGTLLHSGTFGGSGASAGTSYDAGIGAAIDVNGDAYFAGYFSGTGAFTGISGCSSVSNLAVSGWDYFISKIDASGNCVWVKGGGTTNDGDGIQGMVVDNTGTRVYAVGNFKGNFTYDGSGTLFSSYAAGNLDGFLLTVDASNGANITETYFGGASHDDNGRTIAINAAEDIIVGGATSSLTWAIGGSGTLLNNWDGTGGTFEGYIFRWDHSNWPAYTSSASTNHMGVGEWVSGGVYTISTAGSFNGASITFPNVGGSISSTQNTIGNYTDDVYMATCNTFGDYQNVYTLMNGNCFETTTDACVDASGNVYYTGYGTTGAAGPTMTFTGTGIGTYTGGGRTSSFIGKSNSTGTNQWGVFLKYSGSGDVISYGICTDNSGNVFVTGGFTTAFTVGTTTVTATSAEDIFVLKFNSGGTLQWAVNFASTSSGSERGYSISVDNSGNYYVSGIYNTAGTLTLGNALAATTLSDAFVMKGNATTGAATKGYKLGGSGQDYGYHVYTPNSVETYVAFGRNSGSYSTIESVDMTIATPAPNWTLSSTTGGGYCTSVATDLTMANGYLYVTGYTGSSGTLEFGSLSTSVTSDSYVVSVTSWGGAATCLKAFDITGATTVPQAIAIEEGSNTPDHGDNAVIAGSYSGKAFIHKFTTEGCAASERRPGPVAEETVSSLNVSSNSNSVIYPNPMNASAVIEIRGEFDFENNPATVQIVDMTGRAVSKFVNMNSSKMEISTDNLPEGIYMYIISQDGKQISNGKMIVQH